MNKVASLDAELSSGLSQEPAAFQIKAKKVEHSAPDPLSNASAELGHNAANQEVCKTHCNCCGKKLGVLPFECRCGLYFCRSHLHAELHACTFDYRCLHQSKLSQVVKKIAKDKLERF